MKASRFLLLSFLLFSQLGEAQDESPDNAKGNSSCKTYTVINETANTSSTITRCLNGAIASPQDKKPEPEAVETQSEENPNIRRDSFDTFTDLDAQISMAKSTQFIKEYTFWGIGIGAVGLFFLYRTLSEAQGATSVAENAQRAHVFLEVRARFCGSNEIPPDEIENKNKIKIEIGLRNFGHTPATRIEWNLERSVISDRENRRTHEGAVDNLGPDEFFEIISLEETAGSFFKLGDWPSADESNFFLNGTVHYGDVFDTNRTHTVSISDGNIRFQELYKSTFVPFSSTSDLSGINNLATAAMFRLASVQRPYFRASQQAKTKKGGNN